MSELSDTFNNFVQFLNTPGMRAITLVLSSISIAFSYVALRKTSRALQVQEANVLADHERYLQEKWQTLYLLTLNNAEFAQQAAAMYGMTPEEIRQDAVLLLYLNIAATNFAGWTMGVIPDPAYKSHMRSIFDAYKGDRSHLIRLIELMGYDKPFQDACKKFLASA